MRCLNTRETEINTAGNLHFFPPQEFSIIFKRIFLKDFWLLKKGMLLFQNSINLKFEYVEKLEKDKSNFLILNALTFFPAIFLYN